MKKPRSRFTGTRPATPPIDTQIKDLFDDQASAKPVLAREIICPSCDARIELPKPSLGENIMGSLSAGLAIGAGRMMGERMMTLQMATALLKKAGYTITPPAKKDNE